MYPVDDQDEEERGESSLPNDAKIDACEDVDGQLMKDAADDVDDAHNDELVSVYDKENHVVEVGKIFPSTKEFRMCFKTYAVKHEFDAKTMWTDGKKFYARCKGFDGSARPCKWRRSHAVHGANHPLSPTVPERLYPAEVYVERTLRVWAMSRWRGAREFTNVFLALGFGHLPRGSSRMYRVEKVIHNGVVVAILAHFTNNSDSFYLLGRVF
ncbi:auxin-induced protein 5ng4 [Hordeum vulgare]|nr:auxin-induced protein 5ng4 [Hordeum vulgare]